MQANYSYQQRVQVGRDIFMKITLNIDPQEFPIDIFESHLVVFENRHSASRKRGLAALICIKETRFTLSAFKVTML